MMNRIILTLIAAQIMFAAVNYSYDAAGRLVKIDYGSAGSIAYTYDKGGNLLSRTVSGGSATGGTITSAATAFAPVSAGIAQNTWLAIKGTNLVPANTPAAGVIWSTAPEFLARKDAHATRRHRRDYQRQARLYLLLLQRGHFHHLRGGSNQRVVAPR